MEDNIPSKALPSSNGNSSEQQVINSTIGGGLQSISDGSSNIQVYGNENEISQGNINVKEVNAPVISNSPGAKIVSLISIRVLICMLVSAIFAGWALWYKSQQPYKMAGLFNIAVVEFGKNIEAKIAPSKTGKVIIKHICDGVDATVDDINQNINNSHIATQCISIQNVSGKNILDALQDISIRTNADLVIYGTVANPQKRSNIHYVTPQFYIPDDYIDGGEILNINVGSNSLGESIAISLPALKKANKLPIVSSLSPRIQSLVKFAYGSFIFDESPSDAGELFSQAAEMIAGSHHLTGSYYGMEEALLFNAAALSKLSHKEYKNYLYLFNRAKLQKSKKMLSESAEYLEKSKQYAEQSSKLFENVLDRTNHQYARAYIGLGTLNYGFSNLGGGVKEIGPVDKALNYYRKAIKAKLKPPEAYVDAKANFLIGLMLTVKVTEAINQDIVDPKIINSIVSPVCLNNSKEAIQRFKSVITEYESEPNNFLLRNLAAKSHMNLGFLYQFCGDVKRSDSYQEALNLYSQATKEFKKVLVLFEPQEKSTRWTDIFSFGQHNSEYEAPWQSSAWEAHSKLALMHIKKARIGEKGSYNDAVIAYGKFIDKYELDSSVPTYTLADAYYHLGLAFEELGEVDKSRILYEKIFDLRKQLNNQSDRSKYFQNILEIEQIATKADRRLQQQ